MSAQWRGVFTFNKFTSVAARAVRSSYKEDLRVAAEKRGLTSVRYQTWENGVGGAQTFLNPEHEDGGKAKKPVAV